MGIFFTCDDSNSETNNTQVVLCNPNGEKYIGVLIFFISFIFMHPLALGEYSGGMRNDQGTLFYTNGDRYEGHWLKNMRHGKGTFYDNDGSLYIGDWYISIH